MQMSEIYNIKYFYFISKSLDNKMSNYNKMGIPSSKWR